jgi:hypothetical protein
VKIFYVGILLFLIYVNDIFCLSWKKEYFYIENNTDIDVVIDIEINAQLILDEHGNPIFNGRTYYMEYNYELLSIPIMIDDCLYKNYIKSTERVTCLEIGPAGNLEQAFLFYDIFTMIPIEEQLKLLLKNFFIKDINGNILFAIDDFNKSNIIKSDYSAGSYMLILSELI